MYLGNMLYPSYGRVILGDLCDMSCDTGYSDGIRVSTNEVVLAVQALGANKASGLDGIVAEHLLY